ncbi:DNA methyltransferase [Curtanaerobium respiraculi]|uniref:DNA methyltransferase n=1 Tax=Curtanaerobium respiraculi TaxID=2949669 RepID=UPI0024B347D1|nr:DNA methyltransferase [Curtanaerobium respiraculi]
MTPNEQKTAAKKFVERWQAAEGNEQRESNSFWIELCSQVLGIANPTQQLDFERKVKGRRIDVFYEDRSILIENKSRGVSLDEPEHRGKDRYGNKRLVTPFEQAKWYADNITPRSVMPKWIITCNFDEIRIHDLDKEDAESDYETIRLEDLPNQYHRLSFFTRKENSRLEREKQLSVKAGEVVGKLYDAFAKAYRDIEHDEREQRSLNILVTRIVFLLFAEDAELLQEREAFYKYLKGFQVNHMRQALIDLFGVLKTPREERDYYLGPDLAAFPYVNGGLFEDEIIIPQFDENTRFILLQEASAEFDWKDISPTIFGAVFESTLNPETRRAGGMHYTSIENIHKLTGPLFYDALRDELTAIEGLAIQKERRFKLGAFRAKLASLKFLDPACGSGNFLTETYLSLRKLENRVLEDLYGGQMVMGELDPIQVTTDQFFGIEINDFAVEVAKTALWIAELQMLDQTREILSMWIDPLPLKANENIHEGNALRMDWEDVLSASECSYVVGNPPFIGQAMQTRQQSDEVTRLFPGVSNAGKLDYVAGWFKLAALYTKNALTRCAFVSSNSICQGESVAALWKGLFDGGCTIDFAYTTFVWNNEASDKAHVHVVIVGFSMYNHASSKTIIAADGSVRPATNINGYLKDAPNVFVRNRTKCINASQCVVTQGSQPMEDGQLNFTKAERDAFVTKYPGTEALFKPVLGSREFLNDTEYTRFCLWLVGVNPSAYEGNPEIRERIDHVREYRMNNKIPRIRKTADAPHLFTQVRQPDSEYLIIPRVSSSRREYIPIGYVSPDVIANDAVVIVTNASLYDFGLLSSRTHNAWMRTIAGRLKSDYRYAPSVYYNFPYPDPSEEQRARVEEAAQNVIAARECHPDVPLAKMYDPDKMPKDLHAAHKTLDAAVEAAYGIDYSGDEEKIVAHLFQLYAKMTEGDE